MMAEIDKISSASFAAADALAKLLITPARVVAQYGAEIVHHLRLGIRLTSWAENAWHSKRHRLQFGGHPERLS